MNTEPQTNLTNIRNFLHLIYWEENASQEEVFNFLQECVTYVFNQYGIDRNKFNIGIHFVSIHVLQDAEAKMVKDEKHENKFYILLNKKNKSFKCSNKNYDSKYHQIKDKKGEIYSTPTDEEISNFYTFIISFLHEVGHVIQYIRNPKVMCESDENTKDFEDSFEIIDKIMPKCKEKRAIIKNLNNHRDALYYMSQIERDADKKAYIYFVSILQNLIRNEQDEDFLEHLCSLYNFTNHIRKDFFTSYRKHNIRNRTAINCLNDLNFTEVLEDLTKTI